jgi:hypothetical protein
MTCATTGRREHGTTRSDSGSSPNTIHLGWEYYRNLTINDFEGAFKLETLFTQHRFFTNWQSFDLYFCGIVRGVSADAPKVRGWDAFVENVDNWLGPYNGSRRGRYRKGVAKLFGDRSFVLQRAILSCLNDLVGRLNALLG